MGALLLGIVVLVVGLVQLSPGAEAAQHRYYLMGAGAALTGGGVIAAVLRYLHHPAGECTRFECRKVSTTCIEQQPNLARLAYHAD